MLNAFRMNLYRAFRTKGLWVVLTLMAIIPISETLLLTLGDSTLGGTSLVFMPHLIAQFVTGTLIMLYVIGLTSFADQDRKNGFIKNISGQSKHRYYSLISKNLVGAVYVFVAMLVFSITEYICCVIRYRGNVTFFGENAALEISQFFTLFFMISVFIGLLMTAATLLRGSKLAMVLGILLSVGFESLLVNLGELIHVSLSPYLLMNNIGKILSAQNARKLGSILLVGVAFLGIYSLLGAYLEEKRDVV